MTNKEKAREIAEKNACDYPFKGNLINTSRAECEYSAIEMAEWKDQQYKKEFNVPDYCKSFEDISNYIGNDVFAIGYNKAKAYDKKWFIEKLKSKKSENGFSKLNTVCDISTIDTIIDELIEEVSQMDKI